MNRRCGALHQDVEHLAHHGGAADLFRGEPVGAGEQSGGEPSMGGGVDSQLLEPGGELGARMAGPAIRARSMARVLGDAGHEVVLATTSTLDAATAPGPFRMTALKPGDDAAFAALEAEAELIVFQGHAMEQFPALAQTPAGENRRIIAANDDMVLSFGTRTPTVINAVAVAMYAPEAL